MLNAGTIGGAILVVLFVVGLAMVLSGNTDKGAKTETASTGSTYLSSTASNNNTSPTEIEGNQKERTVDLQSAKRKIAEISGYPYSELLSENNNKWYLAPTENANDTVRGSGGNVNKGVLIYSVDKSTGEVTREQ